MKRGILNLLVYNIPFSLGVFSHRFPLWVVGVTSFLGCLLVWWLCDLRAEEKETR